MWPRSLDEMSQCRRRLAEAHVVGEAAAEAQAFEEPQPARRAGTAAARRQTRLVRSPRPTLCRAIRRAGGRTKPPRSASRRHRRGHQCSPTELVTCCSNLGGELEQGQRIPPNRHRPRCRARRVAGGNESASTLRSSRGRCGPTGRRRTAAKFWSARRGPAGCRDRRHVVVGRSREGPLHDRFLIEAGRPIARRGRRPAAATVACTRCSCPISSMPASSSAGAWSRNSSAASTSSSTATGCPPASGASTSTLAATVVASSWTVEERRGRCCGLVATLDGEGIARPHIGGGAAPPPTIGLVDELQVDPATVEAIVGDDEVEGVDQHRFATGPVAEALENLET